MNGEERPVRKPTSLADGVTGFINADGTSVELVRECLWRILDRMLEVSKAVRRSAVSTGLLVILFELLNRNLIGEASEGGIKLTRLNFVEPFIPVAVGYMWLRISALLRERDALIAVYCCITKTKFPGLYSSDIDRLLIPTNRTTIGQVPSAFIKPTRIVSLIDDAEIVIYNLLPVAFTAYAFVQLFRSSGFSDMIIWFSCALTVLLLACGFVYFANRPER